MPKSVTGQGPQKNAANEGYGEVNQDKGRYDNVASHT